MQWATMSHIKPQGITAKHNEPQWATLSLIKPQ